MAPRRSPEQVNRLRNMVVQIGDAMKASALFGISYQYALDLLRANQRGVSSVRKEGSLRRIRKAQRAAGNARFWASIN
jgi:hypothetical protein